jgi:hypothetical protein
LIFWRLKQMRPHVVTVTALSWNGPLCVGAGLVADRIQLRYALLEHRIGDVGDSRSRWRRTAD